MQEQKESGVAAAFWSMAGNEDGDARHGRTTRDGIATGTHDLVDKKKNNNEEMKRKVLGIFSDEIYKSLKNAE